MPRKHSPVLAIGMITLIAGTLDILDALIFYKIRANVPPARLLQGIASHLIGKSAFSGGMRSATLGLALHYLIALCWVTAFAVCAHHVRLLLRKPVLCGVLYGVLIYAVMNFIVVPHTANPSHLAYNPINLLNGILAIVLFMGVLVAVLVRRFAP